MDTGNKTLAQLSEEGKEARYVTLDVGAKISGYTKDYLERLCRLHKVNFLERNIGEHVIELESLLKETHTILLSYEGLTFVDKADLNAPSETALHKEAEIVPEKDFNPKYAPYSAQIPNFAQNGRDEALTKEEIFSFTGRAVVSDAQHPEESAAKEKTAPAPSTISGKEEKTPPPAPASVLPQVVTLPPKRSNGEPLHVLHNVVHIPIAAGEVISSAREETPIPKTAAVMQAAAPSAKPLPKVETEEKVSAPTPAAAVLPDEWDARLLGGERPPSENEIIARISHTPLSPYHPVVTSQDPRDHHEDLPLFPPLIAKEKTTLPADSSKVSMPPLVDKEPARSFDGSSQETPKQVPLTKSGAPLFGGVSRNAAPARTKPSLPMMRVMPTLPAVSEDHLPEEAPQHHLAPPPASALLTKSLGFNIAFMALLVMSSLLLLSRSDIPGSDKLAGLLSKQVAAVGEAFGNAISSTEVTEAALPAISEKGSAAVPEFSDDVIITPGDSSDTVLIQPVFRDGYGSVTEYPVNPVSGE